MSQEKDKGDAILEGQELGIERGKKENVTLHTHFEYDDALIDDTERMSRQLAGQRKDLSQGDAREGVETRLRSAPAEPRFNVMSTTASGAKDLPDTKLGGDVKHIGHTELHKKFKKDEREDLAEPSVMEPGYGGMPSDDSGKQ